MISVKTFPSIRQLDAGAGGFAEVKRRFGFTDLAAFAACRELSTVPGPISGELMAQAIMAGAHDKNRRATATELREFQRFAREHREKLTPEAAEVLGLYEQAVATAAIQGHAGVPDSDFRALVARMRAVTDSPAEKALAALDLSSGPVSPSAMTRAILTGIRDRHGNATGDELRCFEAWAQANAGRLGTGARKVLDIYRTAAAASLQRGNRGLTSTEFAYLAMRLRAVK